MANISLSSQRCLSDLVPPDGIDPLVDHGGALALSVTPPVHTTPAWAVYPQKHTALARNKKSPNRA
jgi:hypothetical protein